MGAQGKGGGQEASGYDQRKGWVGVVRPPPGRPRGDWGEGELARWRERRTFYFEVLRAVPTGVSEAFWGTFFLMLAIKHHGADALAQAVIAAAGPVGLLLGPLFVLLVKKLGMGTAQALALAHYVGGVLLMVGAMGMVLGKGDGAVWFVGLGTVAVIVLAAATPVQTQFYEHNYRAEVRGRLFSAVSSLRVAVTAVFTLLAGYLLAKGWVGSGAVMVVTVVCLVVAGMFLARCPGEALEREGGWVPFGSLGLVWRHREFGWLIVVWMFMGSANVMMFPLRMKFVVEERYGFGLDEAQAGLLLGVLPSVVFFLTTWWWGRQYDRWSIFLLRVVLNVLFAGSNLLFFLSGEMWGFVLGAALLGFALAGGSIDWSLWVTKLAPPGKAADYMAVHTFFTGIRGIFAPAVAVPLAEVVPMENLMWASCAMLGIAVLLLLPEVKTLRRRRPAVPVLDKAPE